MSNKKDWKSRKDQKRKRSLCENHLASQGHRCLLAVCSLSDTRRWLLEVYLYQKQ